MEKRFSFILISVPSGSRDFMDVINIISCYESHISGSMLLPNPESKETLFGVLLKAENDIIGAISGRLGNLPNVKVKSAVLPL